MSKKRVQCRTRIPKSPFAPTSGPRALKLLSKIKKPLNSTLNRQRIYGRTQHRSRWICRLDFSSQENCMCDGLKILFLFHVYNKKFYLFHLEIHRMLCLYKQIVLFQPDLEQLWTCSRSSAFLISARLDNLSNTEIRNRRVKIFFFTVRL